VFMEDGAVILEFDDVNEKINHLDKYNRLLAYIYLPLHRVKHRIRHGEQWSEEHKAYFLNASLIGTGYGLVYRRYDFKHKDEFLELEAEAKENKRGIWE